MNSGNTRLFLAFNGLILIIGAILWNLHWSLTAACALAILYGLLAFFAGWNVGFDDGRASSRRPAHRPAMEQPAIRVGSREIPVNGRARRVEEGFRRVEEQP